MVQAGRVVSDNGMCPYVDSWASADNYINVPTITKNMTYDLEKS